MNFSDETLMAYVDQQLDAETRAALEAAMTTDIDLARRVERHAALAAHIRSAFEPVLDEPVPLRLQQAVAVNASDDNTAHASADIIDFSQRRKPLRRHLPGRWSWPQWGAVAASLVVGVMAGRFGIFRQEVAPFATVGGQFVARGGLEHALSAQLASAQSDTVPVRIGISFVAQSGEYCRTFMLAGGNAGLACKADDVWHVRVLAQAAGDQASGTYRMAGSGLPPAVMREVDAAIAGAPLDAAAEAAAQRRDWRK